MDPAILQVQDEIVFLSAEDATNSSKGEFPAQQIAIKKLPSNFHTCLH
jgi:hypothetical protein